MRKPLHPFKTIHIAQFEAFQFLWRGVFHTLQVKWVDFVIADIPAWDYLEVFHVALVNIGSIQRPHPISCIFVNLDTVFVKRFILYHFMLIFCEDKRQFIFKQIISARRVLTYYYRFRILTYTAHIFCSLPD
jgi:hypothetical protein